MPRSERSASPWFRNVLATLIAGGAFGISQVNLDPFVSGADGGGTKKANAAAPRTASVDLAVSTVNALPKVSGESDPAPDQQQQVNDFQTLRGIWAIKMSQELLKKGCANFAKVSDYTAHMYKQERIGGVLSEGQAIDMKVRHEPFSVYMKWQTGDRGRQLIYVEGQNDGNMLVQPGGIKGRLTGLLNLEPTGSMAMSESRFPITKAGLLQLGYTVMEYQDRDIARGSGFQCELRDNQEFESRPCYLYQINYDSPQVHESYRKSLVFIDKELSLPICVKNYTWAKDATPETIDDETLIEFYAYSELRVQQQLGSVDFDQHNGDYKLRVRK